MTCNSIGAKHWNLTKTNPTISYDAIEECSYSIKITHKGTAGGGIDVRCGDYQSEEVECHYMDNVKDPCICNGDEAIHMGYHGWSDNGEALFEGDLIISNSCSSNTGSSLEVGLTMVGTISLGLGILALMD